VSAAVSIRWQEQMEDMLQVARERVLSAAKIIAIDDPDGTHRQAQAAIAQAAATTALALAVANGLGDTEAALDKIAEKIAEVAS